MIARRLVLTDQAQADLISLADYITVHDGRARAIAVAERIQRAMESLTLMPGIGGRRYYLKRNQRAFSVSPWMIFYEEMPGNEGVTVVRVIDGRRDLPSVFNKKKHS